jgi:PAS domain S-box-containing protein
MKGAGKPGARIFGHPEFSPGDFGIGVLFDSVRDGVIIADAATERIVLWNSAAETIFGYSAKEALEMPLHALVPERLRAQHRRGLAHYYETGRGLLIDSDSVLDLPGVRKDGTLVPLEFTLTPVKQRREPSRYVLAVVRDVTARKEMEAELRGYHAHLEQGLERERAASQRLVELDELRNDFVAMVVHDLRNPMAAIRGLTKTLQARWEQLAEDDRASLLDSLATSTTNLGELVDEVFMVAKIESGEFSYHIRPFDLTALLHRSFQEQRAATDGVCLREDVPADLPAALGDERRQRQIVNNLLSNAIKFSPPGAPVDVTAGVVGGVIEVSITDRGRGIHPDDHKKLFKKFSRLEPPEGKQVWGTGLGLFICKQMVEAQGGRIRVSSTPGKGSTFTYTVPVAPHSSG